MRRGTGRWTRLLRREDFRADPLGALGKRLRWRMRWMCRRSPWRLVTPLGFPLAVPKSGSGALIYYQGFSEPATAHFLLRVLRPGMVVFDVGAHFGEYTVLAARRVGPGGSVHAFEPQPSMYRLLEANVTENGLGNVVLNRCAVADCEGEAQFWQRREPASSSLAGAGPPGADVARCYRVPVVALDAYCERRAVTPELIKADVEGAERLVLEGARRLCSLPAARAPVWVLELSESASLRFGESCERWLRVLAGFGYAVYRLQADGRPEPLSGWDPLGPTENVVAAKRVLW